MFKKSEYKSTLKLIIKKKTNTQPPEFPGTNLKND